MVPEIRLQIGGVWSSILGMALLCAAAFLTLGDSAPVGVLVLGIAGAILLLAGAVIQSGVLMSFRSGRSRRKAPTNREDSERA
jgi:hypothetical protein